MAQATLVENQIEDGERLVEALLRANFSVEAACWIRTSEDERWYLYIASKLVDDKGPAAAYRDIHLAMRQIPDVRIGPFEVKAIGAADSITIDVLEFQRRYPTQVPAWFHGARLGDVSIDEAFIYAPAKP
jgi:hypothetical protein